MRKGETRRFTDDKGVAHIRKSLDNQQECQVSFINYKKNGDAFVNLVTIIPIAWDESNEIRYLIGFQVDLEQQPGAILRTMHDGSYAVNYSTNAGDPYPPVSDRLKSILDLNDSADESRQKFNDWVLDHADGMLTISRISLSHLPAEPLYRFPIRFYTRSLAQGCLPIRFSQRSPHSRVYSRRTRGKEYHGHCSSP